MAFVPINFNNKPLITPMKLRHIELQYGEVLKDVDAAGIRVDYTAEIRVEVRSTTPGTLADGRLYFNTATGKLVGCGDGITRTQE